jgi:hypothetical protein
MQLLSQHLSCGDPAAVQLRLRLANGQDRDMIVGSVNMPHDSEDFPAQEEVKKW